MAKRKQTEYIQGRANRRRTEGDFIGVISDAVALADKPAGTGAASWLVVQCLTQSIKGAHHD